MSADVFVVSELDSHRFGLRIARCRLDAPINDSGLARQTLRAMNVDVLVLRVRSGDVSTPRELARGGGKLIYADSLVYYSIVPSHSERRNLESGVSIRRTTAGDATVIGELARAAFSRYPSHYAANPLLASRGDVGAGYAEWAMSHVLDSDVLLPAWVAEHDGAVVGFVTVKQSADRKDAEILLNAVHRDFQSRGLYTSLLFEILRVLHEDGVRLLRVSTQLSNIRVQRVWSRLGMTLERAYDTYHLNLRSEEDQGRTEP